MLKYENGEFIHPVHGTLSKQLLIDEILSVKNRSTRFEIQHFGYPGDLRAFLDMFCRMGIFPEPYLRRPFPPSRAQCKHTLKFILDRGICDEFFTALLGEEVEPQGEPNIGCVALNAVFLMFELYPKMVLTTIQHAARTMDDRYIAEHILPNTLLHHLFKKESPPTPRVITKTYRRWYSSRNAISGHIANAIIPPHKRTYPFCNIPFRGVQSIIERIRRLEMLGFSVFTERVMVLLTRNTAHFVWNVANTYRERMDIHFARSSLDFFTLIPTLACCMELYDSLIQRSFLKGITLDGILKSSREILFNHGSSTWNTYNARYGKCTCTHSEETVVMNGILVTQEVKRRIGENSFCGSCEFHDMLSGAYLRYKRNAAYKYTLFDLLLRFLD